MSPFIETHGICDAGHISFPDGWASDARHDVMSDELPAVPWLVQFGALLDVSLDKSHDGKPQRPRRHAGEVSKEVRERSCHADAGTVPHLKPPLRRYFGRWTLVLMRRRVAI